jgi:transcriptional regulator with XRE-family HTH domain
MPVGQKLEEARKRKGVSVREVSESTKIRGDYLSAIETGNYDIKLPEVYLRGFVRLYAKFLGLDQDALVADLDNELGKVSDKNAKKSLGSIVSNDNSSKQSSSSSESYSQQKNRSLSSSRVNYLKPVIYGSIGLIGVLVVILFIYLLSDSQSGHEIKPSETKGQVIVERDSGAGLESILNNSHILKISITGDVSKLIICDEGKSPNVFHEFDSLNTGWEKEIAFEGSFRCYSSSVENIVFAVDEGKPSKVGGNKTGIGTFSWKSEK